VTRGRGDARRTGPPATARAAIPRSALLFVALVALVANVFAFDARLNTNGDNAQFLVLAESIRSGHGLSHVNSPGNEPHTKYPFLYPLLLATVLTVFPGGLVPAKMLSVLFGVASIPLLVILMARRVSPRLAVAIGLAAAVSPHLLEFSHITLSEIPFLFFSLVALLLLERIVESPSPGRARPVLALLAIMATYYVKSIGLALALAAPLACATRRRFRLALFFLAGFVVLSFPWYLRNKAVGQGNLYLDYFLMKNPYEEGSGRVTARDLLARVGENAVRYERYFIPNGIVPPAFRFGPAPARDALLFLAPLALVAIGIVAALRAGFVVVEIYTILSLAIIHAWPEVWSSTRFFLALIPLFLAYAVFGVERIARRFAPGRAGEAAALAVAGLLVVGNVAATARDVRERGGYTADWANFFAAADWIRGNTPPGAIVSSRSGYILYWKTHRKSVGYPFSPDAERVFAGLVESGARYVLVDSFFWTGTTGRYLVPALEAHRDRWRAVWSAKDPPTYVLEMLPAVGTAADSIAAVGRPAEPGAPAAPGSPAR